ncbi:MAG: UDP-3-O-acyl-N-acetylglucosamine deacetylase [Bacillota bacterium]
MRQGATGRQTTIARPASYEGRGLHTGERARITISPAPAGTGILFGRIDLSRHAVIPATVDHIGESHRATNLCRNGITVLTVEHLLAAIMWCGIDNAIVEVDGGEVPLGDGSALTFVELVEEAGVRELDSGRTEIRVQAPARVTRGQSHLVALPYEGFRVSFTFVGARPGATSEYVDFEVSPDTFKKEIAPARTVGFEWELNTLREKGLALGATRDQAVIVGDSGYVGASRFPDEAARHKALDLLGDIALVGRVAGHFIGVGSGHSLNHELARILARQAADKGGTGRKAPASSGCSPCN